MQHSLTKLVQAASSKPTFFQRYCELDKRLVEAGYPATSPWWLSRIQQFYETGKRQLVARVGRRGGKSSTLCRIAVCEAIWGDYSVPPGDIGVIAIVSINKAQASERVRTVESILKTMGMKSGQHYRRSGDSIELIGKPVKFETFAATRGASVGFTGICLVLDEIALWRNDETGANPADEILAWLRPTIATQKNAKIFLSSSPFSTLDAHHTAFVRGDTQAQMVCYAPTWVANPTLTEEETHSIEPELTEWQRQFLAIPMSAGSLAFFDPKAIDDAVTEYPMPLAATPGDVVTVGADFGFRSDSSALAVAHRTGSIFRVAELLELRPESAEPLKPSKVVETFSAVVKRHGAEYLMADGHYRQSISEHLETFGLQFVIAPEGAKGNQEVFVRARRLLLDGELKIPKHERLIKQLKQVVSAPTAGGGLTIRQPRAAGGGHGDLVSALVLAVYQREGTEITVPRRKLGEPGYWQWYNSAEQVNAREEEQQAKEVDEMERETEWWER